MMIVYAVVFTAILVADILTKIWASATLAEVGSIPLISGVFNLTYAENTGAAFSILRGQRWFFIIVSVVMLAIIGYVFFKNIVKGVWGKLTLVFIAAGAVGNFIDRVIHGYVVDMFEIRFIRFPIFNVADVFLTAGAIMFIIYVLFIDKELLRSEKKNEDNR